MRFLGIAALVLLAACLSPSGFASTGLKFLIDPSSLPKSYQRVKNNFPQLEAPFVHSFTIQGGECHTASYGSSSKGDCDFGSVRSLLREEHSDGRWDFSQPQRATYSWDMLIPNDFPTKGTQSEGSYIFAQWKGAWCPNLAISHSTRRHEPNILYLRLQTPVGDPLNHECADVARIPLVQMSKFKGQWHNISVNAEWSKEQDGQVQVFIDGQLVGKYKGPTLAIQTDEAHPKSDNNHFDVGVYLCCTGGTRLIKPGTVYFANVRRIATK